jgi:hypothetical protein
MKIKAVWKFPLSMTTVQDVAVPVGAKFLSVHVQGENETPMLWALVEPKQRIRTKRRILIFTTGQEITETIPLGYIGSFFTEHAGFVGHVFEEFRSQEIVE